MKRFSIRITNLITLLLGVCVLSGCVTVNMGGENTGKVQTAVIAPTLPALATIQPPQHVLSEERLQNAEYLSPLLQVPFTLVDGAFSGVVDSTELNAVVQPGIAYGDLNNDGIEEAAFVLAENSGGSGVFNSLLAVYSDAGQYTQAQGVIIDDRPVIDSVSIEDGVVKVQALVHAPNDAMVNPTTRMSAEYSLWGSKLVQTRLSSTFAGGGEHAIYIDMPRDGESVSGSLRVTGSMPIAPFENNLSLLISDPLSGQLLHEGFLVQAEDMGAPATFDNTVVLPDVAAGKQILLVLSELSMADGTPMALDAVWLSVK